MRSRSIFVFGLLLLCSFGGFIAVSIFSNLKLNDLHGAQNQLSSLLLTWKKCENLSRELLITYNLSDTRDRWLAVNQQFDIDFLEFLSSPVTLKFVDNDVDFQTQIALIKMRKELIQKRLEDADRQLEAYIVSSKGKPYWGNPLVDFGENLAKRNLSDNLMNLLRELRFHTSLSPAAFTEGLSRISQYVTRNIQVQTKRLRVYSLLLSAFILGTAGLFILYRVVEITRSRETAQRHARELSTKIEERKNAEDMLLSERDKLRGVLNALGEGMYIVNRNFIIEYQNTILEERYGHFVNKKCYARYMESNKPCNFCLLQKTIESNKINHTEAVLNENENYDMIFSPFSDVDGEIKVIVFVRDVTEKRKFEAEVMRAAHLASIGELAAGVAHEINNPINGIINYAERLEGLYPKTESDLDIPNRIIKEGERIAEIVSNLLSFARVRKQEPRPANIKDILEDTLGLVKKQMTYSGINLRVDLNPSLPMIEVRNREIQQVFLNIISNARYALNKKFPIANEDKILEINGYPIKAKDKEFVRLIFRDKGTGIPSDIIDKIFNPFFTTKPKGGGTGLGLSISHGIIKSHGGNFAIQSVPGEYSTVTVDLPVDGQQ